MPIYEYECKACGRLNEVWQKITDPAPVECEACHKGPLAKKVSATGFVLKGGGWYVTDFRGNGSGGKPAPEAGGGDANTKSDAKTEAPSGDGAVTPSAAPSSTPDKSGASSASAGGCACHSVCPH